MDTLKPCPFCGNQDIKINMYSIDCEKCGGVISAFTIKEQAIEAWNKRTSEWVSVEDRLPKESGLYIVTARVGSMSPKIEVFQMRGKLTPNGFRWMEGDWVKVLGWMPMPEAMPLPQPPKGDE